MKSGDKGLIGKGDNDYGRSDIIKELTPELSDKIFRQIQQHIHDERVSKQHVLHHLKQLKAQMGKLKKNIYGIEAK